MVKTDLIALMQKCILLLFSYILQTFVQAVAMCGSAYTVYDDVLDNQVIITIAVNVCIADCASLKLIYVQGKHCILKKTNLVTLFM